MEAIVRAAWLAFAAERPGLYAATLRPPGNDPEIGAAMASTMRPLLLVLASYGLRERWRRTGPDHLRRRARVRHAAGGARSSRSRPDPDETVALMIDTFTSQLERTSARSRLLSLGRAGRWR